MPEAVLSALSVAERQATWVELLAKGEPNVLVAERGTNIMGFLAFGPSRDECAAPDTLEILALYVSPHSWSNGAGRALYRACCSSALSVGTKMLTVWALAENNRARQFYVSVGFREQTGTSRPYERHGVSLQQVRYAHHIAG
jgi:L-amino acid N-acyltransferase YncA